MACAVIELVDELAENGLHQRQILERTLRGYQPSCGQAKAKRAVNEHDRVLLDPRA